MKSTIDLNSVNRFLLHKQAAGGSNPSQNYPLLASHTAPLTPSPK
jgi:hypothetical protein